jgi:nucleotide-binding universal stress UspA family protein
MTVVVGVDGSSNSYAAIRVAWEEASLRGTGLVAVMAMGSESALGAPAARPLATSLAPEEARVLAESTLRGLVKAALEADGGADAGTAGGLGAGADNSAVQSRVEAGQPGRVLVEAARTLDAVMIVLAVRKERTPSRLLGAVSQYVLRNAPCPVLVVPEASKAR